MKRRRSGPLSLSLFPCSLPLEWLIRFDFDLICCNVMFLRCAMLCCTVCADQWRGFVIPLGGVFFRVHAVDRNMPLCIFLSVHRRSPCPLRRKVVHDWVEETGGHELFFFGMNFLDYFTARSPACCCTKYLALFPSFWIHHTRSPRA